MVSVGLSGLVIDSFVAVDRFSANSSVKYHFLSSAHPRHCRKLTGSWNSDTIYCSLITAKLLPLVTRRRTGNGIQNKWIWPLALNVWHKMEGFSVMLIDANHAPGAVMFIFEGERISGGRLLYTGFFRADAKFYQNATALSVLQEKRFGFICFDSTYIDFTGNEFPSRESSAHKAANVLRMLTYKGVGGVVIPVPVIGRELFLIDIARELQRKICLHKECFEIAQRLGIGDFFSATEQENTCIWTCSQREKEQILFTTDYHVITASMAPQLRTHEMPSSERDHLIWYSDHCSPAELHSFLSLLSFARVIGIPNKLPTSIETKLEKLSLPSALNFQTQDDFFKENPEDVEKSISPSAIAWRVGLAFDCAHEKLCDALSTAGIADLPYTNISNENSDMGEMWMAADCSMEGEQPDMGASYADQLVYEPDPMNSHPGRTALQKFIAWFNGFSDGGGADDADMDEDGLNETVTEVSCIKAEADSCLQNVDTSMKPENSMSGTKADIRTLEQQIDIPGILENLTETFCSRSVNYGIVEDSALLEFISDMDISTAFKDLDEQYEDYQQKNKVALPVGVMSQPYNIEKHVCYDPLHAPLLLGNVSELLDDNLTAENQVQFPREHQKNAECIE